MEQINFFELLIKNIKSGQIDEKTEENIIKILNELAEINPKCKLYNLRILNKYITIFT